MKNLFEIKKIHFVGIKGVAMSALAVICGQAGFEVAGSDVAEEFITDKVLAEEGVKVFQGFAEKNLDWEPDLVVNGASWGEDNIEVIESRARKIPIMAESVLRGQISGQKNCIAVTGVHGKTTTTSLLSYILKQAGMDPGYLIGTARIPSLGNNGHWGSGNYFVVEGDEYIRSKAEPVPKFLDLRPDISIITSLEWEHVDVYRNVKELQNAFAKLIRKTKKLVIACADWNKLVDIIDKRDKKIVTYGFSADAVWQVARVDQQEDKTKFVVKKAGKNFGDFELKLMGRHNALNALSCVIAAQYLGIDLEIIKKALADFSGLERRFELSEKNGIFFVDDYAHHPTEVICTLKAIRDKFLNKKIWCVFQAHMVSRTQALLDDFSKSFGPADKVIITDIFASAREKTNAVTGKDLAIAIKKYHSDVEYTGSLDKTADYLRQKVAPGEVVVTMGAGDVYKLKDKI